MHFGCCQISRLPIRLAGWPVLVDLVEDRVVSRAFTVVLFMVVFAFVLRALYVVFLTDPFRTSDAPPGDLQLLGTVVQGASASVAAHACFEDPHGAFALQGLKWAGCCCRLCRCFSEARSRPRASATSTSTSRSRSTASVGLLWRRCRPCLSVSCRAGTKSSPPIFPIPGELAWQQLFGLEDTMYDYTGIPIGGRYSLPGFPPRALLSPIVSGDVTRTDSSGYARFSDLALELGLPARYSVSGTAVLVTGQTATVDAGVVTFTSSVGKVALRPARPLASPARFALGETLPPFSVWVRARERE